MSRVTGVAAVTTPGSPEESISALATGCDSPGISIAFMDWLLLDSRSSETKTPLTPQTHPTMPPRLSAVVAARKCSASGDLDLVECSSQRSSSTAPAARRATRTPSRSKSCSLLEIPNPACRQLSREADRSLTATITLSTQIMLKTVTLGGGYRQNRWDASVHKKCLILLVRRFI